MYRPLLLITFLLATLPACTTSPGPIPDPLANPPAATTPHITTAKITAIPTDPARPAASITLTKPSDLSQLLTFFPHVGDGRKSAIAWSYDARYKIQLTCTDGRQITIVTDEGDFWSEGRGDWWLPSEFQPYITDLFRPHQSPQSLGITAAPGSSIPWEQAQSLLLRGDVKSVYQSHHRGVTLSLKDGTSYITLEPNLDDVINLLHANGLEKIITIITE